MVKYEVSSSATDADVIRTSSARSKRKEKLRRAKKQHSENQESEDAASLFDGLENSSSEVFAISSRDADNDSLSTMTRTIATTEQESGLSARPDSDNQSFEKVVQTPRDRISVRTLSRKAKTDERREARVESNSFRKHQEQREEPHTVDQQVGGGMLGWEPPEWIASLEDLQSIVTGEDSHDSDQSKKAQNKDDLKAKKDGLRFQHGTTGLREVRSMDDHLYSSSKERKRNQEREGKKHGNEDDSAEQIQIIKKVGGISSFDSPHSHHWVPIKSAASLPKSTSQGSPETTKKTKDKRKVRFRRNVSSFFGDKASQGTNTEAPDQSPLVREIPGTGIYVQRESQEDDSLAISKISREDYANVEDAKVASVDEKKKTFQDKQSSPADRPQSPLLEASAAVTTLVVSTAVAASIAMGSSFSNPNMDRDNERRNAPLDLSMQSPYSKALERRSSYGNEDSMDSDSETMSRSSWPGFGFSQNTWSFSEDNSLSTQTWESLEDSGSESDIDHQRLLDWFNWSKGAKLTPTKNKANPVDGNLEALVREEFRKLEDGQVHETRDGKKESHQTLCRVASPKSISTSGTCNVHRKSKEDSLETKTLPQKSSQKVPEITIVNATDTEEPKKNSKRRSGERPSRTSRPSILSPSSKKKTNSAGSGPFCIMAHTGRKVRARKGRNGKKDESSAHDLSMKAPRSKACRRQSSEKPKSEREEEISYRSEGIEVTPSRKKNASKRKIQKSFYLINRFRNPRKSSQVKSSADSTLRPSQNYKQEAKMKGSNRSVLLEEDGTQLEKSESTMNGHEEELDRLQNTPQEKEKESQIQVVDESLLTKIALVTGWSSLSGKSTMNESAPTFSRETTINNDEDDIETLQTTDKSQRFQESSRNPESVVESKQEIKPVTQEESLPTAPRSRKHRVQSRLRPKKGRGASLVLAAKLSSLLSDSKPHNAESDAGQQNTSFSTSSGVGTLGKKEATVLSKRTDENDESIKCTSHEEYPNPSLSGDSVAQNQREEEKPQAKSRLQMTISPAGKRVRSRRTRKGQGASLIMASKLSSFFSDSHTHKSEEESPRLPQIRSFNDTNKSEPTGIDVEASATHETTLLKKARSDSAIKFVSSFFHSSSGVEETNLIDTTKESQESSDDKTSSVSDNEEFDDESAIESITYGVSSFWREDSIDRPSIDHNGEDNSDDEAFILSD